MTIQLDLISEPSAPVETAPAPVAADPAPQATPAAQAATPARTRQRRRGHPFGAAAYRPLAVAIAVAYATCVAIQPVPADPVPVLPWWYTAVDLASLAALVVACMALGRGRAWAPVAVVLNGVGMIAETITCPASGHHHVLGWWWYVQLTLSAAVLLGGLALWRGRPRAD